MDHLTRFPGLLRQEGEPVGLDRLGEGLQQTFVTLSQKRGLQKLSPVGKGPCTKGLSKDLAPLGTRLGHGRDAGPQGVGVTGVGQAPVPRSQEDQVGPHGLILYQAA